MRDEQAGVAQLAEHLSCKQKVRGSSPLAGSNDQAVTWAFSPFREGARAVPRPKPCRPIPRLRGWVAEEPLNERLWVRLMLALHHAGHQAEALDAYRSARRRLVTELGVEPGKELSELQRQILAGNGEHARKERSTSVPRQLPPDVQDFIGRAKESKALSRLLSSPGRSSVPVIAISGAPGVGKTALALHVGHLAAPSFPDGQPGTPCGNHPPSATGARYSQPS